MPTYTYACLKCDHAWDVFHAMSAQPQLPCPSCRSKRTRKQIGTGAGIIFKGSGFYETDFKEKKGGKTKEGGEAKPEPKADTTAPAKSETRGESKPAAEPKPAGKKPAKTGAAA